MNSKRPGTEKNARTDNLYMMHGLRTVFHQLMAETSKTRLLSQKRHYLPFNDLTNQEVVIEESVNKRGQKVFSAPRMTATQRSMVYRENLKIKGQ